MRRGNGGWGVVACVLVAGVVTLPSPALAWQAFAKITNSSGVLIKGDSTVKGFEEQIVVRGLGNGLTLPVVFDSSGGTSVGKMKVGPFQLVKGFDVATPKLITAAANASVLRVEVTIFKTTATGTSVPGFKLVLTGALLTQVETQYDPGADPSAVEKVEFVYTKLVWTDLLTGLTGSTP